MAAETSTLARPYARALFELAQARQALDRWSETLGLLAAIAADKRMQRLLAGSALSRDDLARLFLDVAGDRIDQPARNLVRLLAENRRLGLLPEIARQFEARKRAAEGRIDAEVVSAYPLSADQAARLARLLQQRLGREVTLQARVDRSLIGGVVLRAGDLVIDASVQGQLARLGSALIH